jgi:glyoxylase-like metal-dependent hydrolase (beta-lactamase superfamily II)
MTSKLPRPVFDSDDTLFAFPPNRDTLGGTAYFIATQFQDEPLNVLVDCPAWDEDCRNFLTRHGGVHYLVITHRGGIGQAKAVQDEMHCAILMQEQEAYLLPESEVESFRQEQEVGDRIRVFWTPGHSPGSSCVYDAATGVLFTGRHLLPDRTGHPVPLRTSKTFHWLRQLRSVQALRDRFTPETLRYICPGANTGFLRGSRAIADAYIKLMEVDIEKATTTTALI